MVVTSRPSWIVLATCIWAAGGCRCNHVPLFVADKAVLVIGAEHPGSQGNRFGYEGGSAVKVDGTYHLFVSEMYAPPLWDGLRFGHWTSTDRVHWTRLGTVLEKANAWSPIIAWDEDSGSWFLFYVQYRWNRTDEAEGQHDGTIVRMRSVTAGRHGIGGPYEGQDVVMKPDAESAFWEGQQGVDSFFPYRVGRSWVALYGSHNHSPPGPWVVGLATAPGLAGPFKRLDGPIIEPLFIENPIVGRDDRGSYLAVYDSDSTNAPGAYVADGQPYRLQFIA